MSGKRALPPTLERIGKAGPGLFLFGLIGFIIGLLNLPSGASHWNLFWHFYLYAWVIAMGYTLGCYGFMLLQYVVKASWGYPVVRIWEAGARMLPVMAVIGLPLWFNAHLLYPWAQDHAQITDRAVLARYVFMNPMSVLVRSIFYFAFWIGTTFYLTGISRRLDENPNVSLLRARTNLSAFLLVVFVLTVNFAYTDWVMSLEKHWYSTIFGLWFLVSEAICAVGLVSLLTMLMRKDEPYRSEINDGVRRDFGNLMLLCVMFWGYFSFSQWVIIWSGNLPDEIEYYLHRFTGDWLYVGAAIVVLQFFGPFVALLSGKTKRYPLLVGSMATWLMVMRLVDVGWTIFPSYDQPLSDVSGAVAITTNPFYILVGALLAIALMGAWITLVVEQLRGARLSTYLIPEPVEEALNHA